jgi:hypothetical protein
LKPNFSEQNLSDFQEKFQSIEGKADRLVFQYVSYPFKNKLAKEYANHGFGRRVGTLWRCIENVFKIIPPETTIIPAKSILYDTQINIQAFIANVYGGVDNLAWTLVHERGLTNTITRTQVGLRKGHTAVRSSLSPEFQTYLSSLDEWFDYVVEYARIGHPTVSAADRNS